MEITKPFLKQKFEIFNTQIFNNKLPLPAFKLCNVKGFLGQCCFKKSPQKLFSQSYNYNFILKFNTRYSFPESIWEDLLIHEMIHYYIAFFNLKDTSPHGKLFKSFMTSINEKYQRNIQISYQSQSHSSTTFKLTYKVIAVFTIEETQAFKVLPRVLPTIKKYYYHLNQVKNVKLFSLYLSNNPFFNNFPRSGTLFYHLAPDNLQQILADKTYTTQKLPLSPLQ